MPDLFNEEVGVVIQVPVEGVSDVRNELVAEECVSPRWSNALTKNFHLRQQKGGFSFVEGGSKKYGQRRASNAATTRRHRMADEEFTMIQDEIQY
ncbi:MAG: hypothetical protein CM1200mP9_07760 [Gammaproteobacteria bacterium]|nr:MAG: hypothetical protein CM1200mP9_07760 [Gammaproteobacteria bacterium]